MLARKIYESAQEARLFIVASLLNAWGAKIKIPRETTEIHNLRRDRPQLKISHGKSTLGR